MDMQVLLVFAMWAAWELFLSGTSLSVVWTFLVETYYDITKR